MTAVPFETIARTVAVDFDGVIHPYTNGWTGPTPDDEPPTPGAAEALATLAATYRVVVFSTRCMDPEGTQGVWDWLDRWDLRQHITDITCQKPPAVAYVDDRAVVFRGSWGDVITDVTTLADGRAHGAAQMTATAISVSATTCRYCGNSITDASGGDGDWIDSEGEAHCAAAPEDDHEEGFHVP